jgi:hypothetical protein
MLRSARPEDDSGAARSAHRSKGTACSTSSPRARGGRPDRSRLTGPARRANPQTTTSGPRSADHRAGANFACAGGTAHGSAANSREGRDERLGAGQKRYRASRHARRIAYERSAPRPKHVVAARSRWAVRWAKRRRTSPVWAAEQQSRMSTRRRYTALERRCWRCALSLHTREVAGSKPAAPMQYSGPAGLPRIPRRTIRGTKRPDVGRVHVSARPGREDREAGGVGVT